MRMRCLRILPEIAANTTCVLLSSWTLKNALGCLSIIVPSAGIKSSFANRLLLRIMSRASGARVISRAGCPPLFEPTLFLIMIDHATAQQSRDDFPIRRAKRARRKVGCAHARNPPLFALLFVAPAIVRAVITPAVENSVAALRLLMLSICIDSQPVHLVDLFLVRVSARLNRYSER